MEETTNLQAMVAQFLDVGKDISMEAKFGVAHKEDGKLLQAPK